MALKASGQDQKKAALLNTSGGRGSKTFRDY